MKVVILEDEKLAAEKLERYLYKYDQDAEVLAHLSSVKMAIDWFSNQLNQPDLIFADIQLTDGLSFEVFIRMNLKLPVIFTTAYDEYAIDAFKVNSIDYLLKPITFMELSRAIGKVRDMRQHLYPAFDLKEVNEQIQKPRYKDRFLVKISNRIQSVPTNEILFFYAEGRTVFLVTTHGKRYIIDFRLMQLEDLLDPKYFFRVNRSYILSYHAISNVEMYSNSRLAIELSSNHSNEKAIVSREKVADFKKWLEGGN